MCGRKMRFSEYMNAWLYGDEGYYKHFKAIGKAGDFYTAVSTSRFFGASIANYFYKLLQEGVANKDGWLIEIGAHQGYLICDMIQWLYTCEPALAQSLKFGIVERQPAVQKAQKAYIKERFGDDVHIVHFDDISEVKADYAFVVANEIFDAFACELLKDEKIAHVDNHEITWKDASPRCFHGQKCTLLRKVKLLKGMKILLALWQRGLLTAILFRLTMVKNMCAMTSPSVSTERMRPFLCLMRS